MYRSVSRQAQRRNESFWADSGVKGVKSLGVSELHFKLCLLATQIQTVASTQPELMLPDSREV